MIRRKTSDNIGNSQGLDVAIESFMSYPVCFAIKIGVKVRRLTNEHSENNLTLCIPRLCWHW